VLDGRVARLEHLSAEEAFALLDIEQSVELFQAGSFVSEVWVMRKAESSSSVCWSE